MKELSFSPVSWSLIRDTARTKSPAVVLALLATSASAANLAVNGNFEQLLAPGLAAEFGTRYPTQQVIGWNTDGYNYVFTPGSADSTGATGEYGNLQLWGPNNGSANGLTMSSPAGGNFLAFDGDYGAAPITQTINGLTPGHSTTVSFYWAGAQQSGYPGPTTEQFEVSFGGISQFTPVLDNAPHGFTGWTQEVMTFMPTSSSEVLSFFAIGTPSGVPPFALLDGVSVSDANAPEPATWSTLALSLIGIVCVVQLRRKLGRTTSSETKN